MFMMRSNEQERLPLPAHSEDSLPMVSYTWTVRQDMLGGDGCISLKARLQSFLDLRVSGFFRINRKTRISSTHKRRRICRSERNNRVCIKGKKNLNGDKLEVLSWSSNSTSGTPP